jgi:phospholipase C
MVKSSVRLALAPMALGLAGLAHGQAAVTSTTPIQHVIVLFQENVSFDHYFGTYPGAQNNSGEQIFTAFSGTPTVNGFTRELLLNNPNKSTTGAQANPQRFAATEAFTCSQNHSYGPEQEAVDSGLLDKFPQFTAGSGNGCATDGSTVMSYYDGNTVAAFWNYAQNFAMSDNSFDSTFGPSTPGAINLISGQTAGALTHFGTGSTNTFPNTVSDTPKSGTATGTSVTDIGDLDAYLDDCGNDKGGTNNGTTTLEMNSDASAQTGHKNIGDLLNAQGITWGWFGGGFRPTTASVNGSIAVCGASRTGHMYPSAAPSANPSVTVPNPAINNTADIHTAVADYVSHHSPFMYYASTRNPHHLPPSSVTMIGQQDQANHQYDTLDFVQGLQNGVLPAVSFLKAPAAYDGHPGNSDPTSEQYWLTQIINTVMLSPFWQNTAIIIAYDDSDGWYDHVTGPIVSPSNISNTSSGVTGTVSAATYDNFAGVGNCGTPQSGAQQARCGHGPRLPLVVISPYANSNFVDHTLTDQASIIQFVETNWNLGTLDGATPAPNGQAAFDANAGSISGMFNFNNPANLAPVLLTCSGAYATSLSNACQLDPTP